MAVDHLNASIVVLGRSRLYWVSVAIMSRYQEENTYKKRMDLRDCSLTGFQGVSLLKTLLAHQEFNPAAAELRTCRDTIWMLRTTSARMEISSSYQRSLFGIIRVSGGESVSKFVFLISYRYKYILIIISIRVSQYYKQFLCESSVTYVVNIMI